MTDMHELASTLGGPGKLVAVDWPRSGLKLSF